MYRPDGSVVLYGSNFYHYSNFEGPILTLLEVYGPNFYIWKFEGIVATTTVHYGGFCDLPF